MFSPMKKSAFTLVELLVVMTLLIVLASMTAVMMGSARAEALKTKTQREIDLIEQILLTRMAEMGFSPVPFVLTMPNTTPIHSAARLRLMGRRDQLPAAEQGSGSMPSRCISARSSSVSGLSVVSSFSP